MARVTIEDCIRYYPNRFEMVLLASKRARQLLNGLPSLLENEEGHKHPVQALKEMGEGDGNSFRTNTSIFRIFPISGSVVENSSRTGSRSTMS